MSLKSANHTVQVLEALQTNTRNGCEIYLSGNDNSRYQSDSLWILSPLVRSIIDSLGDIRDNLIILPDFSYEDIKTGLEITEGVKGEVLMFTSSTKVLLETLGVDLRNCWSVADRNKSDVKIKTEKLDEDEDDFDESDDLQNKLIMDIDLSDSQKLRENKLIQDLKEADATNQTAITMEEVTVSGLSYSCSYCSERFGTQNRLWIHMQDKHRNIIEEKRAAKNRYVNLDLINNEKLKEVETLIIKVGDFWECKICDKTFNRRSELRNHAEIHVGGLSYQCQYCSKECGTRISLRNHVQRNHILNAKKSQRREKRRRGLEAVKSSEPLDFQQQRLREVEKLLVRESGGWKCKECNKITSEKWVLRKHAEIHVSGLSFPCKHCNKVFTTRSQLAMHPKKCHNQDPTQTQKIKKSKSEPLDFQQQRLREVEKLLVKESEGWKCKECNKITSEKWVLRKHAEIHVSGLSFPCKHCGEIFTTRSRLAMHPKKCHNQDPNQTLKVEKSKRLSFVKIGGSDG